MSNRICFISKTDDDISKINIPTDLVLEGGWRYESDRKCIFTLVKTIEVYGDRSHGIKEETDWIERAKKWAKDNNLILTSDYELSYS